MRNLTRFACFTTAVGLGSLAFAQQAPQHDAAPFTPVLNSSTPTAGNGTFLTLGDERANYDAQTATGDNGGLGVGLTDNFFYVSGRGVPAATPANGKIYKFDFTGALVNTFSQNINAASSWGDRDLATDDANGALYGGSENGWFTEYALDGAGDISGTTSFTIPGVGTVRALARDQSGASAGRIFWTASFNGAIFCFDLDGGGPGVVTVLGSFGNPGKAFYGFADDPNDPDKIWGHSQNSATSTFDLVEWNEMSQTLGWAVTGQAFDGTYVGTGVNNIAGGADTGCVSSLASSGFYDFVGFHQGTPDAIFVYESNITKGTATTTFCTAKTGLVCGVPAISASGTSSVAANNGFVVKAGPARSNKSGILLLNTSLGANPLPYEGGTLCVNPTGLRRAGSTNSQGMCPPGNNCLGEFAIDLNTWGFAPGPGNNIWQVPDCSGAPSAIPPNNAPGYMQTPGTTIFCQYWGRDSVATGSFVSDGLNYTIGS